MQRASFLNFFFPFHSKVLLPAPWYVIGIFIYIIFIFIPNRLKSHLPCSNDVMPHNKVVGEAKMASISKYVLGLVVYVVAVDSGRYFFRGRLTL